jgi:hypothetical protein
MYTILYIVNSKHQHHKFWWELLGGGYLLAQGIIELLGSRSHGAPERFISGGVLLVAGCASGHAFGQVAACILASGRWRVHAFVPADVLG